MNYRWLPNVVTAGGRRRRERWHHAFGGYRIPLQLYPVPLPSMWNVGGWGERRMGRYYRRGTRQATTTIACLWNTAGVTLGETAGGIKPDADRWRTVNDQTAIRYHPRRRTGFTPPVTTCRI